MLRGIVGRLVSFAGGLPSQVLGRSGRTATGAASIVSGGAVRGLQSKSGGGAWSNLRGAPRWTAVGMLVPKSSFATRAFMASQMGVFGWLAVDLAINWVGFVGAYLLKTEKFFDAFGSSTFLISAIGSLLVVRGAHPRQIIGTAMAAIWAVRLGSFLLYRVLKTGKDSRFDEIKEKPGILFFLWSMQGVWAWVVLLPVLLLNTSPLHRPMMWTDAIGVGVWATGLALEAVADYQKLVWKLDPANKGKFIDVGLWSCSRYPNYCGEMALWWGVVLLCAGSYSQPWQFAALISPLFTMYVLARGFTGIPTQEAQAKHRWGHLPEYQQYVRNTPLLLPLPRWSNKDL